MIYPRSFFRVCHSIENMIVKKMAFNKLLYLCATDRLILALIPLCAR